MEDFPRRLLMLLAVLGVAVLIMLGMAKRSGRYGLMEFLRGHPVPVFAPEQYTLPAAPALAAGEVPMLERLNSEYARLTAAVVPSVVSVDTSETVAVQSGFPGYYRQYQQPGLGSGVIVTPEGHVVTNNHVVANKDAIRVTRTTPDGRRESFAADLVGAMASYDIAVLKIRSDRRDFPALKFGDSGEVKVGQLAFAVGNPYGLEESVTQGIISALDRRISDTGPSYFQTDTPINPGNSGGPLVNFRGEIIGINSVVLRGQEADRAPQNIGFAIPSQQASEAFQMITGRGRPVFGYLGLALADVTPAVAAAIGMPGGRGAWVQGVMAGGPAAQAGLRPPDVITAIDGEGVSTGEGLVARIRRTPPGTVVRLGVWRDSREQEVKATVGDSRQVPTAPSTPGAAVVGGDGQAASPSVSGNANFSVARAQAILRAVGIVAGVAADGNGVVVEQVSPSGLGSGKIFAGDRILSVNKSRVASPAEFNRAVLEARTAGLLDLEVEHGGQVMTIPIGR